MSDDKDPKKRGGARKGAGRKKTAAVIPIAIDGRTTSGRACAGVVLELVKVAKTWVSMVRLEQRRLGIDPATGELLEESKRGLLDGNLDKVIDGPDFAGKFSVLPLFTMFKYLEDRHYGKPQDNVNHIHNKPIEHSVTLTISERFRIAMEKADKRVANR